MGMTWVITLYMSNDENNHIKCVVLIRLPLAATFKLPSRKRGWGCVMANLHTPLSPLFRGESKKIEIPEHQVSREPVSQIA